MAEKSIFWTTGSTGDGATEYTQAELIRWVRQWMIGDSTTEGVHKNYLNELEVTGTSSPVSVNTGAAIVYGFPYWNTASETVAVPTPSSSTRIDRIVLEADWTAQTVRITRVAGTEGAGAPSLTQTDGVEWQIPLAQASITTGGVITVTDERAFVHPNIEIETSMIEDEAVTAAKIDNRTRTVFIPCSQAHVYLSSTVRDVEAQGWVMSDDGYTTVCKGWGRVPEDFASGLTIEAVIVGSTSATGNIYTYNAAYYGAVGESYTNHTAGASWATVNLDTTNEIFEARSMSLSSAAAGDHVSLEFQRNPGHASDVLSSDCYFAGWLMTYTADS